MMSLLKVVSIFIFTVSSAQVSSESVFGQRAIKSDQFRFILYDGLTEKDVGHKRKILVQSYKEVMLNLKVEFLPVVTVKIWKDSEMFYQIQKETIDRVYKGSGGYVRWDSKPEIRILYPKIGELGLLHEFVHIVTLEMNPTITNNPRWFWESVAIYEAGGPKYDPKLLSYSAEEGFPTLHQLSTEFDNTSETRKIYEVGYVLIEYIVEKWGRESLITLINSNGDIPKILAIPFSDFESKWHEFLECRYLGK